MSRLEVTVVVAVVVVASWVVATALPDWSQVAWAGGVLLLLVIALIALTARAGAMRHPGPSPFGSLLMVRNAEFARPADLERIERLAGWVAYSQHDFNQRLKPMLVQLISHRLEISRGLKLEEGEVPSPELLSARLAALIAPATEDSPSPITTADLNRALDEIEAL
ncbi:MAG: hypothetical protein QOH48_1535 [Actinomycetota bacterium]|jgi:hypothetical protein|nr:hypothetical protein [Actinomycetota bacterium]